MTDEFQGNSHKIGAVAIGLLSISWLLLLCFVYLVTYTITSILVEPIQVQPLKWLISLFAMVGVVLAVVQVLSVAFAVLLIR